MAGIWAKDDNGKCRALEPAGYATEAALHQLVQAAPGMLPLAGATQLAILGGEVHCGRERADLVAVEIETGRQVVIEIKLSSNVDRRQALTQLLGYAAYLRQLDPDQIDDLLSEPMRGSRVDRHSSLPR